MALIQSTIEYQSSVLAESPSIIAMVVTTAAGAPFEYQARCDAHYLLGVAITPRPETAWISHRDEHEKLPVGDVLLLPPGIVQFGTAHPARQGTRKDLCCLFPAHRFDSYMDAPIEWDGHKLDETIHLRDPRVRMATTRLSEEVLAPGMARSVVLDSLACLIATDIERYFKRDLVSAYRSRFVLSIYQLREIEDFILEHIDQEIYLSHLTKLLNLSGRHLLRMFKATTGETIAAYIAKRRVGFAQDLLSNTNVPIKAVAKRVGFSNVSSFATAFKRSTSTTPTDYRRRWN